MLLIPFHVKNVSPWPRLTNSSPLSEWCQETSLSKNVKAWILRANHHEPPRHQPSDDFAHLCTLGRSIIEGDAKWDGDLRFTENFAIPKDIGSGLRTCLADVEIDCAIKIYDAVYASLFTYDHNSDIVKAFCEAWCPLTNTLHTSAGEMSISLWDLHELVGLPMTGCLYDEVVPSALELTGVDEKRERFIPRSCKYLLYAYHLLQSTDDDRCSHVSIDKWVKFWSKKTAKYHPPPPRKEKKTVRPKSTHNPLGDIATHERWSTAEDALFAKLCIERSLKEEVYLAAYLACWLCLFVLPGNDVNSIRPSTFKMASLMANGRRVNLAIPVLASIYEGLNTIATSPKPAELRGPKMTRFSGEGGAKYYEPREARKRIHKAEFVSWACNMLVKAEPFKFVDDGRAEELDHSYFVAIRSSYLTLRRGGRFIVEPYSPHRFGRQFGPKSIKITLKRKKDEDKQVDGDSDSSNKDRHWKRQRKETMPLKATETNENASRSSLANFVAELEDEVQSIDVGEESETSHSSTMTPPLGMGLKRKQSSPPAAVSVLKGESFLFNYQKEFLQRLWSGLIVKISNTPIDFLSSIEDDVHLILESMKSFQKFDFQKWRNR
ncbi:hypothetical protein Sango_2291800 [Sesamum angolense]|uniref:Aminotransferase-like plant mobile domain-containing protein n=1 Tax=Sesamum angolense TaxID=2727404 RepID=A0AAE1WA55_9LAMI|nr:hypothetical protein Sango_2291800 [Sesamum angolense]